MKTVRIEFSKTGRARFISHLDLTRMMTRAVRRAAIPVWYTEGFNRHPYLTFAAPLSLGYEGACETMDLRLVEELDLNQLVERLDVVMPEGFRILSCFEAVAKPRELAYATYELTTNCPIETVRSLLSQSEILVEKRTKKKEIKQIDIRPYLNDAVVMEGTHITLSLPCSASETVNPSLLFDALDQFGNNTYSRRVLRAGLYLANGERFR